MHGALPCCAASSVFCLGLFPLPVSALLPQQAAPEPSEPLTGVGRQSAGTSPGAHISAPL